MKNDGAWPFAEAVIRKETATSSVEKARRELK